MAALTWSPRWATELTVLLKGRAEKVLTGSLRLEMFAIAAVGVDLGENLRGRRIIPFADDNAGAGPLRKSSSRTQGILAFIGSF